MPELQTLITGLDFGEGPRWHDGRLWYSDFYQHRVSAVTVDGEPRRPSSSSTTTRAGSAGCPTVGRSWCRCRRRRCCGSRADGAVVEHGDLGHIATGRCNDMVVSSDGNAYVGNFGFESRQRATTPQNARARARPARRHRRGRRRRPGVPERECDHPRRSHADRRRDDGSAVRGVRHPFRRHAREPAGLGAVHRPRPDGCTLDAEGAIWVANAFGTDVARVLEGGEITDRVDVGQATYACALGGDDGRTLFLVSADSADEKVGRRQRHRCDPHDAGRRSARRPAVTDARVAAESLRAFASAGVRVVRRPGGRRRGSPPSCWSKPTSSVSTPTASRTSWVTPDTCPACATAMSSRARRSKSFANRLPPRWSMGTVRSGWSPRRRRPISQSPRRTKPASGRSRCAKGATSARRPSTPCGSRMRG